MIITTWPPEVLLRDGQWHHLVMSVDARGLRLYVDGRRES